MKINREQELSRHLDGELPPGRAEALRRAMEGSAELERSVAEFREIGDFLRGQDIPQGKTAEAVWSDVQRDLRIGRSEGDAGGIGILGSRLKWAAGIMSVMFVVLGLGVMRAGNALAVAAPAEVEWVDTEVPGATTMVYQDDETGLTVIWMMEEDADENGNIDTT